MPQYDAKEWGESPALYDEHTLKINGKDVMEDWELPYMEKLGGVATRGGGAILELGYGMGISSSIIESHAIDSHTVIECHPDVLQKCISDNRDAIVRGSFHLISGFWQDVTPQLRTEAFDGILFDTYPIKQEEMIGPHMFFFTEAFRLLKKGGVLTYYSDEATSFSKEHIGRLVDAGFRRKDIDYDLCEVTPPEGCEYWNASTFVVPIITKGA